MHVIPISRLFLPKSLSYTVLRDIISYFLKLHPFCGNVSCCASTGQYQIINVHSKFEMPSFIHTNDTMGAQNLKWVT